MLWLNLKIQFQAQKKGKIRTDRYEAIVDGNLWDTENKREEDWVIEHKGIVNSCNWKIHTGNLTRKPLYIQFQKKGDGLNLVLELV